MKMSLGATPQEVAEAQVKRITHSHGYLDEYVLGGMNPEVRRMVEHSLIKNDDLNKRVDALAKNVENGSSRFSHFIFDLLRNADDNDFTKARSRSEIPSVTFKVTPSCITVDCNEDGFTPEDVTALCDVGKSSRAGGGPYFSNEGIGFKSVFMIAYKVHIQSGDYSFSFNHKPGQSGMGMISPTWEEHQDRPPVGITRMKLFVHSETACSTVLQQLGDVKTVHLMFLRNIRRINIIRVNDMDDIISSLTFSISQDTENATCLKEENGVEKEKHNYHVTKYLVHRISPHENRTSPRVNTKPKQASSEVVLAFPLDGVESHVARSQQVFAFSAIGNMGFKFLIQADFTTNDNGNDIDVVSNRNKEFLEQISIVFVKAMQQLDENIDLRHEWMRYLPQTYDEPPIRKGYWTDLCYRIKNKMKTARLIRHLDGVNVSEIERFKRFPHQAMDDEKNPIFEVPFPVTLPSTAYRESDLDLLAEYGLDFLSSAEILTGVSDDLKKQDSRMKSPATSERWHTAAANLLVFLLRSAGTNINRDIKEMELIPLVNGTWVKPCDVVSSLSFANIDGIEIPEDLPLALISTLATQNTARAALFTELGAKVLSISDIRQHIFDRYPANGILNPMVGDIGLTEDISVKHLKFLHLTHNQENGETRDFRRLAVFTEGSALKHPALEDVYLFNRSTKYRTKRYSRLAASFDVARLSSCYYTAQWQGEVAWINWLRTAVGIRTRLKLIDHNGPTSILRELTSHRSDKLLGVLQSHWPEIERAIDEYPSLRYEIADALVPCGGRLVELSSTYLPLPKLVIGGSAFLQPANSFPFLDLSNTLAPTDLPAWEFLLDNFGVDDCNGGIFYLDILQTIARDDYDGRYGEAAPARTFRLYELLYRDIGVAAANKESLEYLRTVFASSEWPLILLPVSGNANQRWKGVDDCRWDCPRNMKSLSGLQSHYTTVYDHDTLMTVIRPFMREVVGVPDLSADDVVEELLSQKEDPSPDSDLIRELYTRLPDLLSAASTSDKIALREEFRTTALIFAQDGWHTTDKCVWSRENSVPGKVQLSQHYSGMESTFVDVLGITLDLDMAYDMVLTVGASATATIYQAKEALRRFNSVLSDAKTQPDRIQILRSSVFPVRYPNGSVELSCADLVDFAIADQEISEQRVRDSVKMLDFAPDEVRSLRPLLKWASLENRLLSARVLEITKPLGTTVLLPDPRCSIQLRAHSLCRIAAHFNSPRARDIKLLYRILRESKVFESSPIITELCLVEGGCTFTIDQQESDVYLNYTNDTLNIYIPKDTCRQDVCFLFDLPHALFEWIMSESLPQEEDRETELAKRLIASVLNSEPHSATWFLDKEGIVALDALAADDVSAVKESLRRYRVRLPPVQEHTVTTKSDGGAEATETKRDQLDAVKQQPATIFSGDGIVKTEFCPSTEFAALRLASPSWSSDGHSPSG
ncbi:hypothetical protein ANO14919_098620 [Xylariales sp. No.14919]|nr:hypothetical protein ANO14919_098620 [Xylariales sp. No.14919]